MEILRYAFAALGALAIITVLLQIGFVLFLAYADWDRDRDIE